MRILWSRNRETSHVVCATECQLDTHKRLLKGANSVRSCAGHCWSYVQAKIQCVEATQYCTIWLINWVLNKVLCLRVFFAQTQTPTVMSVMSLPFAIGSFPRNEVLAFGATKPCSHALSLSKSSRPQRPHVLWLPACITHVSIHGWRLSPAHSNCKPKQRSTQTPHACNFQDINSLYTYINNQRNGFTNLNETGSLWYFFE